MIKMPVLRPIPIETKGMSWLKALWVWLTTTRQWEVVEEFTYYRSPERFIIIPAGFVFDGASIPRLFWSVFSPIGILLIGGLIHDFGYRYRFIFVKYDKHETIYKIVVTRDMMDKIFFEVNTAVNGFKRLNLIPYLAVKWFGGFAWRANARKMKNAGQG